MVQFSCERSQGGLICLGTWYMNSTQRQHAGGDFGGGLTDRELSTSVLCLAGIYATFLLAVIVMNLAWL